MTSDESGVGGPKRRTRRFGPPTLVVACVVFVLALVVPPTVSILNARVADAHERDRWTSDGAYPVSDDDLILAGEDPIGAAGAIATILAWNGRTVAEATIADELHAHAPDGVRLDDLRDAFEAYGFAGRWVEASPRALADVNLPAVVHLARDGGQVAILRATALDHVYLADPNRGNVVVPFERFVEGWTGRVLAFPDPPEMPEAWR